MERIIEISKTNNKTKGMKKTVSINISGRYFHIDEFAFDLLDEYLSVLKRHFKKEQGGDEIISDIELRVAELFQERLTSSRQVVDQTDVKYVKSKLGTPADFGVNEEQSSSEEKKESKKEKVYDAKVVEEFTNSKTKKSVFRDTDDRILGGVCSGLSHYFGIDKLFIRLGFILLTFAGIGFTIPMYIILWAIVPKARTRAEKLKMKGEKINVDNIERKVKEEMGKVKDKVKDFAQDSGKHQKMKENFKDMVSEVEPHAKKFSASIKKIVGLLLILGSAFWMIVCFGLLLQVPLVMEILADKDWEWVNQGLRFYNEVKNSSNAYTIGHIGLLGFVFIPLSVFLVNGMKMYFNLTYKFAPIIGLLVIGWLVSLALLMMSGSMIGFQLLSF